MWVDMELKLAAAMAFGFVLNWRVVVAALASWTFQIEAKLQLRKHVNSILQGLQNDLQQHNMGKHESVSLT
jgi:hypothetical protein